FLGQVFIVPLWYQTPAMQANFPMEIGRTLSTLANPESVPVWFENWLVYSGVPSWFVTHRSLHELFVSLAGIVVGGGIVWAVRIAGQWGLRREAMGFGDVVLLAAIGSFLGWQATLVIFFMAPICALAAVLVSALFRFDREIPYGPYLSLATLILVVGWPAIWPAIETRIFTLGPFLPVAGIVMFAALAGLLYVTRTIQKLLGLRVDEPEPECSWTAGDQLAHFAGECVDERQGQWPVSDPWRGTLAGRG